MWRTNVYLDERLWRRRFDSLLKRRRHIAGSARFDPDVVERDVAAAVREVREARAARGR